MKLKTVWNERMRFTGVKGEYRLPLDSRGPVGEDTGFTPKELLGYGIAGCTGMDVVALLKKHKEPLDSLEIEIDLTMSEGKTPAVFTEAHLRFLGKGSTSKERYLEAIQLSQTKFCGVSAMLSKAFPIFYKAILNGVEVGEGQASFG